MFDHIEITAFRSSHTPFYYYRTDVLEETLTSLNRAADIFDVEVHYALKANTNSPLLSKIFESGLGADCVSANEIRTALDHGVPSDQIVFAGVGKTDHEIEFALKNEIFCLNVESMHELEVISEIAQSLSVNAPVALRINPDVDAHTNRKITTGTRLDKFGIGIDELSAAIEFINKGNHLDFKGLHFHIGSQITNLEVFTRLALKVNEIQEFFCGKGLLPEILNLGGRAGDQLPGTRRSIEPRFLRIL